MAFGNIKGMGSWGVALAASLALHVVVIGTMAIFGMGGGGSDATPPPAVPQTDGRAQDLPARTDVDEPSGSPTTGKPSSPASDATTDRPQQNAKNKQQDVNRSLKADRSKSDSRKVSAVKDDNKGSSPDSAKDGWKSYKVKAGDSLTKIARACSCSVQELAKENGLSATASLKLGQTIKVKNLPSQPQPSAN